MDLCLRERRCAPHNSSASSCDDDAVNAMVVSFAENSSPLPGESDVLLAR